MQKKCFCPVKINLTLRVLSQRSDKFHEIFSLFWKKNGSEGLTITPLIDENIADILSVKGMDIPGPNIVSTALERARKKGLHAPGLSLHLEKKYPPGSGVGAGSGNAAALLRALREMYGFFADIEEVAELGADVSFLAQDAELAVVRGKGEILEPLPNRLPLEAVVVFPTWSSNTAEAYEALDRLRSAGGALPVERPEAAREAASLLDTLGKKERAGFLPNDFYALFREKEEYERAFNIAETTDALAWGLCGSGSALFALCADERSAEAIAAALRHEKWVRLIERLE